MELTYTKYLKIDEILNLQEPLSEGEHDEMLFIIIHQVFELWFKQILHEMSALQKHLEQGDTYQASGTLKRVLTILKVNVGQLDVLETMTPLSFLAFRTRLENSSGFQSVQFRVLEFLLGNKNKKMVEFHKKTPEAYDQLLSLMTAPTLQDSFFRYMKKSGYAIPEEILNRDFQQNYQADERVENLIRKAYEDNKGAAMICELMVDLDEGFQEWRYRHVKMIERTIGNKPGTGGSSGVEYLKQTLFKPIFPDLWNVRSQF